MFKPGSGKYPNEVYDITDIKSTIRGLCNCLLFLHAMTGSDTTSALYRQVKKKSFKLVTQNPELQTPVEVFLDSSSTPDAVERNSCWPCTVPPARRCLPKQAKTSLLHERGGHVPDSHADVTRGSTPTLAAAREHSWRVFPIIILRRLQ